jgi:23S rRNA pseudouridine1911/1915/1917 synthase
LEDTLELTIPETTTRGRIDKVAVSLIGERLTRTQIKHLIEEGDLLVDGEQVRPSNKVGPGQCITIILPPTPPSTIVAQDIPIDVVFEDDDMMVVNKPPGLVVHPAAGNHDGTLVNALMFHRGIDCGEPGRPGIVHRLDKDTSGLMLVAKTESTVRKLSAMIAERHVTREYLALVRGLPPSEGSIETPYGRHPRDRKRFTSRIRGERRASTRYRVERGFGDWAALVRLTLGTGRTHQIRVHMSESGWPLIGDPIYSHLPKKGALRDVCERAGRTMLHATHLELSHPETGSWLEFTREPPEDFQRVLADLGSL